MNTIKQKYPGLPEDYFLKNRTNACKVIASIINYWEEKYPYAKESDLLAILEKAYHGSQGTWLPIEDPGKGFGYDYGLMMKRSGESYSEPLKLYYPRGLHPVVWYENYEDMGKILSLNLLEEPERLLELSISVMALVDGYMFIKVYKNIENEVFIKQQAILIPLNLGREI